MKNISKLLRIIAQCLVLPQKWKFCPQKLNFTGSALFHIKTRICLKYFLNDFLWEQFLGSGGGFFFKQFLFYSCVNFPFTTSEIKRDY